MLIAENSLERVVVNSSGKREWFYLPLDKIYECEKHVSFITDRSRLSLKSQSMSLLDASLHPIDIFFQVIRRRLSMLERPISTTSNHGRVWTGKSPYNPQIIAKLLQILRGYFNYCKKSD